MRSCPREEVREQHGLGIHGLEKKRGIGPFGPVRSGLVWFFRPFRFSFGLGFCVYNLYIS